MRRGAPWIPLLAMNRDLDPLRNRYSEGVGEAFEGHESDVAGAEPPRMEPLKERIAIKALHSKPQEGANPGYADTDRQ